MLDRFPVLEDNPLVFENWLRLVSSHGVAGKQAHDARLIAVMQAHGLTTLLTFNTEDFSRYAGITAIHPDSL